MEQVLELSCSGTKIFWNCISALKSSLTAQCVLHFTTGAYAPKGTLQSFLVPQFQEVPLLGRYFCSRAGIIKVILMKNHILWNLILYETICCIYCLFVRVQRQLWALALATISGHVA